MNERDILKEIDDLAYLAHECREDVKEVRVGPEDYELLKERMKGTFNEHSGESELHSIYTPYGTLRVKVEAWRDRGRITIGEEIAGTIPLSSVTVNEDEKWDWLSMYQDAMNDVLKIGIENRRLEKQNEELEKRVESLQQGTLHAENKRLRVELRIMREMSLKIKWAMEEASEI